MTSESNANSSPISTAAEIALMDYQPIRRTDSSSAMAIVTVMGIVVDHLRDISQDIESSVLGVCGGFQGMSKRARQAVSTASVALDDGCHEGGLPGAMMRIRGSLANLLCRLEASRDFSIDLCERIDEVEERLDLVVRLGEKIMEMAENTEATVKQGLAPMRRNAACRDSYDRVWSSMESILNASRQTGQQICSLVSGMRSLTKDSVNRSRAAAEEDQRAVQSSDGTMRITLDAMAQSYERMNESLSASSALNEQLNLDIGQAVMSMQFQDRINQRIDHIVTTITEIETDLQPLTEVTSGGHLQAIAELWTSRMHEKATMESERGGSAPQPSEPADSIELF
jgi:hypothetical protein